MTSMELTFKTKDCINPFSTSVLLLYPLKTSENFWFSHVFRGYRSGTLVENRLKLTITSKSSSKEHLLGKQVFVKIFHD